MKRRSFFRWAAAWLCAPLAAVGMGKTPAATGLPRESEERGRLRVDPGLDARRSPCYLFGGPANGMLYNIEKEFSGLVIPGVRPRTEAERRIQGPLPVRFRHYMYRRVGTSHLFEFEGWEDH